MTNPHHEKNSKDKQGFIKWMLVNCLLRDPRHLQLLFLSDADKSC